ncbi:MAG TPA: SpoIIE family protein phosphatase [Blastocatellia bacterium]|nr:SpoIIE family protein phosphatase [Blastocatellia bacterium]
MKKRLKLILSGIFFALLIIYGGALFFQTSAVLGRRSDPGWVPFQVGNEVRIREAKSPEAMAALRNLADEVIAINGTPIDSADRVADVFSQIEPGSNYLLTIRRNGRPLDVTLRSQAIPFSGWVIEGAVRLIIPNIFLLTGLAVFLLKPNDKKALLLSLMFGMFTGAMLAVPAFAGRPFWLVIVMLTVNLASLFLWPVFFHFFQIFPEPSSLIRKAPKLEKYLYVPHLITFFPFYALSNLLAAFAPEQYYGFRRDYSFFEFLGLGVAVLYLAGGLLSLLLNYRGASRSSRRKMRVVVAGSIAGFLPFFLVIGIGVIFKPSPAQIQWPIIVAVFCFPLFPLSFAYAIVRHKVIPVRLILRRGVRYLLVSRGFIIIQAIVVFAVLSFLLTGSRLSFIDSFGERADIVVTMAATALAIGALTIVNQQVLPLIDRKFFREAYDAQQLLSDLGMEMRKVANVRQLLELAVSKIQDALHIENVTTFLRDRPSGDYKCALTSYLSGDGASTTDSNNGLLLPAGGYAALRMRRSPFPIAVNVDGDWGQGLPAGKAGMVELRERERKTLRRINSTLLIPVATKDELLGMMSLGPSLGDLPFSREDRQLLTAVAFQMAFAIQNAELVQQVAEEERLRHELEIATAVQRRLFPECPPDVESLELAGVCHPARGVGGDYYDFILLDDNKVGIAVADVAGKGISAALLMSTVQASLRSQAPSVNGKLTELVSSMNRLLHVSTDAASYATFFYAQFDETNGLLTYVNAGHNPPILVRAAAGLKAQSVGQAAVTSAASRTVDGGTKNGGGMVTKLTTGGPIIGAFHTSVYEQESIQMRSGDLLLAYTDGVTEAFNVEGEEFGEDRLRDLLAASSHFSATDLTDKIVESVREWCRDTQPHDDLTLVVMKVK